MDETRRKRCDICHTFFDVDSDRCHLTIFVLKCYDNSVKGRYAFDRDSKIKEKNIISKSKNKERGVYYGRKKQWMECIYDK